eukprot:m.35861 g.35861  ORF g.35861 m.35861 type:complete len:695 (-) comp9931_c0_seq1:115-2199(-)
MTTDKMMYTRLPLRSAWLLCMVGITLASGSYTPSLTTRVRQHDVDEALQSNPRDLLAGIPELAAGETTPSRAMPAQVRHMPGVTADDFQKYRNYVANLSSLADVEEDVVIGYDLTTSSEIVRRMRLGLLADMLVDKEHSVDLTPSNRTRRDTCLDYDDGAFCSAERREYSETDYPFVVKLFLFSSGSQYVCSGVMYGSYWVLTAGHCVYDETEGWISRIVVVPAMNDAVFPFYDSSDDDFNNEDFLDRPFGTAGVSKIYAYPGWATSGLTVQDQALLKLDQRMGDVAGWIGWTSQHYNAFTNFGYPAAGSHTGLRMYRRSATVADNYCDDTEELFRADVTLWGGDSGSSAVVQQNGEWLTTGTLNGGFDPCPNFFVRVTTTKGQYWDDIMDNDSSGPVAKPQVIEDMFVQKNISAGYVSFDDPFQVNFGLVNWYPTASGTIAFTIYASTNPIISTFDRALYSGTLGSLSNSSVFVTRSVSLPSDMGTGEYFIGVLWSPSQTQYNESFNSMVVDSVTASSTVSCTAATSCFSCTDRLGCGWCANTSSCQTGSSSGPDSGSCANWNYLPSRCTDPCATSTSCSSCTDRSSCGWCASTSSCQTGSSSGPDSGSCSNWDYLNSDCSSSIFDAAQGLGVGAIAGIVVGGMVLVVVVVVMIGFILRNQSRTSPSTTTDIELNAASAASPPPPTTQPPTNA